MNTELEMLGLHRDHVSWLRVITVLRCVLSHRRWVFLRLELGTSTVFWQYSTVQYSIVQYLFWAAIVYWQYSTVQYWNLNRQYTVSKPWFSPDKHVNWNLFTLFLLCVCQSNTVWCCHNGTIKQSVKQTRTAIVWYVMFSFVMLSFAILGWNLFGKNTHINWKRTLRHKLN